METGVFKSAEQINTIHKRRSVPKLVEMFPEILIHQVVMTSLTRYISLYYTLSIFTVLYCT